jgi:hypothetical protein
METTTETNTEASKGKEKETEKPLVDKVRGALDKFAASPSKEQIEGWKAAHGDVYISAFSEEEIFIFRSLRRDEYRSLQEKAQTGQLDPMQHEEETVKSCLLWTSVSNLNSKAGTVPSLLEQVLQNSNFVAPHLVSQLVAKL